MHKRDGWELADYDWDPNTGLAKFTYERKPGKRTPDRRSADRAELESIALQQYQPTSPRHAGWSSDANVRAFVDENRDFPTRRF